MAHRTGILAAHNTGPATFTDAAGHVFTLDIIDADDEAGTYHAHVLRSGGCDPQAGEMCVLTDFEDSARLDW